VWCLVGLSFILIQCGDDTVEPPPPEPLTQAEMQEADSIAGTWFEALYDTLMSLGDVSTDDLKNLKFTAMRSGFEEALDIEGGNELGHLGLALIELLEVNYSEDLWAFVDSMESWLDNVNVSIPMPPPPDFSANRHRTAIGNQFQLMVEMPMITVARAVSAPDNISFDNFQTIIEHDIIPKLSNAIGHLNAVERHDTTEIRLCSPYEDFTECVRIDMAEIKVFNAGFYALRSAMYSAIAYDMDLFGPDGTYGWVEELASDRFPGVPPWGCCEYEVVELGAVDDLNMVCYEFSSLSKALQDSLLISILHHNIENRRDYLRLRNGGASLKNAHSDILAAFAKLEQAAAFIRDDDREETEENVIKLADLTDFDNDLENDPGKPNFMDGWTQLEDVIDFGQDLLSGPVSFTEEIAPGTDYTWRIDFSRMFLDPVNDWNDMLPYYRWNLPSGAWIESIDGYTNDWDNGGWEWGFYAWDGEECAWVDLESIGNVHEGEMRWRFDSSDFLVLLDGPNGDPIDPSTEFLYFRDYTFNGLFPEMRNHADWQALYDILR
jgi:hypothetical protein